MSEEIQKAEQGAKKAWPAIMGWVGGITALIGLFASLAGGMTWLINHHKHKAELEANMALAQAQATQAEYEAAVQSYADILKANPLYQPALDQQLNTAMLWTENFHVLVPEGQDATGVAAPALDRILSILDSGMTRVKGPQAADVRAHIGWAHWLNQHIAQREFGPAAEQNFRAALALDPSNVYANAMLGNWMLQNGGSFAEAIQHLDQAVSTGKARPFVRSLQLGGLIDLDEKGAHVETVKAANDARKSGESLEERYKADILAFCFDPARTSHDEYAEYLSAIPEDEVWKTYIWLDDTRGTAQSHAADQDFDHDFIEANLLELSGKPQESLEKYRLLQSELKNGPDTMKNTVDAAISRLSRR
jgi:tetratricopeptide (TPR) repeat protein